MSVDTTPTVDTLWYTRCPVPTASGVAIDTGVLRDEFAPDGVTVSSLRASGDASVRESHFDHTLPASFREGGNVPALWARSRGQRTRLLGLTWVEEFQSLLTTPGSDIQAPADLRGKRVLVPGHGAQRVDFERAMALRGLEATLAVAGLDLEDVTVVDVASEVGDLVERDGTYRADAFGAELTALLAGRGDVVYAKGSPAIEAVRAHGLRAVHDLAGSTDRSHRINNGTPRTITVSEELLAERPDLVTRYLAALLRAASWAEENAEQTHAIVAAETGAEVSAATEAYGPEVHRRLRPSLDPGLVDALTFQKDFLLRGGFLESDVDIASWIDPAPLAAASATERPVIHEKSGENHS